MISWLLYSLTGSTCSVIWFHPFFFHYSQDPGSPVHYEHPSLVLRDGFLDATPGLPLQFECTFSNPSVAALCTVRGFSPWIPVALCIQTFRVPSWLPLYCVPKMGFIWTHLGSHFTVNWWSSISLWSSCWLSSLQRGWFSHSLPSAFWFWTSCSMWMMQTGKSNSDRFPLIFMAGMVHRNVVRTVKWWYKQVTRWVGLGSETCYYGYVRELSKLYTLNLGLLKWDPREQGNSNTVENIWQSANIRPHNDWGRVIIALISEEATSHDQWWFHSYL